MSIEELKKTIEQRTGVPAAFLTGETAEENIAQAKALLAYSRERAQKQPQSTAEQFATWAGNQLGMDPQDEAGEALAAIEAQERAAARLYPSTADGGEQHTGALPDSRPAREQFAEWAGAKLAYDPFKVNR